MMIIDLDYLVSIIRGKTCSSFSTVVTLMFDSFFLIYLLNSHRKMFIGGLSWQTSAEGLREYFSKFGDVTEVMVMKDPTTRRSR